MGVRAIRGAVTVDANTEQELMTWTKTLIEEMVGRNQIAVEDIVSVIFTTTEDLDAAFPAKATRGMPGWELVPLMCAREIPVPGSLPLCVRVMMHVNTEKSAREIEHVFLREAKKLRPDLAQA